MSREGQFLKKTVCKKGQFLKKRVCKKGQFLKKTVSRDKKSLGSVYKEEVSTDYLK